MSLGFLLIISVEERLLLLAGWRLLGVESGRVLPPCGESSLCQMGSLTDRSMD